MDIDYIEIFTGVQKLPAATYVRDQDDVSDLKNRDSCVHSEGILRATETPSHLMTTSRAARDKMASATPESSIVVSLYSATVSCRR